MFLSRYTLRVKWIPAHTRKMKSANAAIRRRTISRDYLLSGQFINLNGKEMAYGKYTRYSSTRRSSRSWSRKMAFNLCSTRLQMIEWVEVNKKSTHQDSLESRPSNLTMLF